MRFPERLADALCLLTKAPRHKRELSELTGLDPATIRRHFKAWEAEGLIEPVLCLHGYPKWKWVNT